jgi:hypothetical protein
MFTSVAIVVFTGVLAFVVLFLIWRAASVYFKISRQQSGHMSEDW